MHEIPGSTGGCFSMRCKLVVVAACERIFGPILQWVLLYCYTLYNCDSCITVQYLATLCLLIVIHPEAGAHTLHTGCLQKARKLRTPWAASELLAPAASLLLAPSSCCLLMLR